VYLRLSAQVVDANKIGDACSRHDRLWTNPRMYNAMRSTILSMAEIVSSMFSSFKSGIPENVEPHHSPGGAASES
jgi:hypothetical protein